MTVIRARGARCGRVRAQGPHAGALAPALAVALATTLAISGFAWVATGAQAASAAPAQPPAAPGPGSGVFRSIDENGTPTFSQTPPAGRASKPVDLKPLAGSIDSARPPVGVPVPAPARAVPEAARSVPAPQPERPPTAAPGPRGMALDTYIQIRRGMSEGEVLGRAGPPDYRGNEINLGLLQESWYYLPTSSDPFTTIIKLRGGRVVETERIRKL